MYLNGKLIGKELKSLRNKKDLSIEQASKNLNVHPNTLSKYEKDASDMQIGTLEKMLRLYGIDELIFFKIIREYNHNSDLENSENGG